MVYSGYHPLKDRPVRIVFRWCTVDIIPLRIVLSVSSWMLHSGYHPLKDRPVRIVFGCCAVDIILSSIVLSG